MNTLTSAAYLGIFLLSTSERAFFSFLPLPMFVLCQSRWWVSSMLLLRTSPTAGALGLVSAADAGIGALIDSTRFSEAP
jgi:hypothetical protein